MSRRNRGPKRDFRKEMDHMRSKARRKAMRQADKATGADKTQDKIYLNGEFFARRTNVGHDSLRHEVYERLDLSDDEVETETKGDDLYVTIPEDARK